MDGQPRPEPRPELSTELRAELKRQLALPWPLDLRQTLASRRGRGDPTSKIVNGQVWRATVTAAGPACSCVAREGDAVVARAWGPGAAHLLEGTEALLGFEDDPSAFQPQHQLLRKLVCQFPGLRLGRGRSPMEVLVATILGQRVTTQEAHDSYRKLVLSCGEPAPGPEQLWVPPTPRALRSLPLHAFHRFGIEGSRARTLIEACRHPRYVERIVEMDPADAVAHLCKLPGVGPWTASITVATALGWADAVVVGDYHVPSSVAWALAGEARADDARMLELLEPYRGQRWRVLRLLGAGHVKAPRRGARRAPWREQVALASRRRR